MADRRLSVESATENKPRLGARSVEKDQLLLALDFGQNTTSRRKHGQHFLLADEVSTGAGADRLMRHGRIESVRQRSMHGPVPHVRKKQTCSRGARCARQANTTAPSLPGGFEDRQSLAVHGATKRVPFVVDQHRVEQFVVGT